MTKLISRTSLFVLVVITLGSCCKEGITDLADLITETIGLASEGTEVTIGEIVDIGMGIKNVIASFEDCDNTEDALSSQYELKYVYRPNNNESWAEIGSIRFSTPDIKSGNIFDDVSQFQFDVAGEYKIVGYADIMDDVEERSEVNNDRESVNIDGFRLSEGTISNNYLFKVIQKNNLTQHSTSKKYFKVIPKENLISATINETHFY